MQFGSNLGVKGPLSYNLPKRRQALLEIRRLIVDEGLSHQEIQLRLNLPPSTYFRYLDLLFKAEQHAIAGNNYTYQRLLNETLILCQRYLRRARKLTEIADDKEVEPEQRIEAHKFAAQLERAAHDMSYLSPAYLHNQKLLPEGNKPSEQPALSMSEVEVNEDQDYTMERKRIEAAGAYRRERQRQRLEQQKQQQQRGKWNKLPEDEEEYDEPDYEEENEEKGDDNQDGQERRGS